MWSHAAMLRLQIPPNPTLSFDLNQSGQLVYDGLSVSQKQKLWFDSVSFLSCVGAIDLARPESAHRRTRTGIWGKALQWPHNQTIFIAGSFSTRCAQLASQSGKDSQPTRKHYRGGLRWTTAGLKAQTQNHLPAGHQTASPQEMVRLTG